MEIFWFKPRMALVICKQTTFDYMLEAESTMNWNVVFIQKFGWTLYFRVGGIREP